MKKRLIIFILIGMALNQSVANTFGQGITLSLKDVSIIKIFNEIERQSDYRIIYDPKFFDKAENVSISVNKAGIDQILEICLNNLPLSYSISNTPTNLYVVIRQKKKNTKSEFYSGEAMNNETIEISGKVTDDKGGAIVGATISVRGSSLSTLTSLDGSFAIKDVDPKASLIITSMGYESQIISLKGKSNIIVKLSVAVQQMKEVVVLNNGYQKVPKERATGSFVTIDSAIINRSVNSNIISRLDGLAPGLLFDKRKPYDVKLQIRGIYSLTENAARPLIVVNDFPFDGDINSINPNDVLSVTILRDAAAASIWGAKAGNGVIVITTKDGQFNQPMQVSFNSSISISNKPRLFDLPIIPVETMIGVEKFLFDKGAFDGELSIGYLPVTEVAEILDKRNKGLLTPEQAELQINQLGKHDVRDDYLKYFYRRSVQQQYSLSLNGGNDNSKYYFSLGYNRNNAQTFGTSDDRLTFNGGNTFKVGKNVTVRLGMSYSYMRNFSVPNDPSNYGSVFVGSRAMPLYTKLADGNGNPLSIDKDYRGSFLDTLGGGGLLDWKYRPLAERDLAHTKSISNLVVGDVALKYNYNKFISLDLRYQIQKGQSDSKTQYDINSHYVRNLINGFTNLASANLSDKYPIPFGDILDYASGNNISHNGRVSINFNQTWSSKHRVDALAGAEIRSTSADLAMSRLYGYDPDKLTSKLVDNLHSFPVYFFGGEGFIPSGNRLEETKNKFVSLFGNAAYTFDSKYTVSASFRRDASNLFGVRSNQKWSPFWSIGGLWRVSNEKFYNIPVLPSLTFRMTYGNSGNSNSSVSAQTIISYLTSMDNPITNLPFATLLQSPNPDLRWERVSTLNFGIDFSLTRNNRISGSVEYYRKKSIDVIGTSLIDPTTGLFSVKRNSANMKGSGIDIQLISKNIVHKSFRWESVINLSTIKNEVSKYLITLNNAGFTSDGANITPLVGYNPYLIVSYKWAGLDPENGDPLGYLDGKISKDYAEIRKNPFMQQDINGSALPRIFGNLLNSFSWKGISLSTNITYRLQYYFRRSTISYSELFYTLAGHKDYLNRWQKPGDEKNTSVPSEVYPDNPDREQFYRYSSVTAEKADHIRLNDLNVSYILTPRKSFKLPFKMLQFYGNISNLNILLWRANSKGLDPENQEMRPTKGWAFGLRAEF